VTLNVNFDFSKLKVERVKGIGVGKEVSHVRLIIFSIVVSQFLSFNPAYFVHRAYKEAAGNPSEAITARRNVKGQLPQPLMNREKATGIFWGVQSEVAGKRNFGSFMLVHTRLWE
jgi:hypothetical protein